MEKTRKESFSRHGIRTMSLNTMSLRLSALKQKCLESMKTS